VLLDRLSRPKYDDAAQAALGVVTKHIEALDEKVESGAKVSQQDHYLHKKLRDIKSEMEQALEDRWENPRRE
jgi:ATP-dependent Lon protease